MSKDIPAALVTESNKNLITPFLLVKLEFDSGPVRFNTAIGDVTFDSEVYQGVGDFVAISEVSENSTLTSNPLDIKLTGVKSSLISTFLSEDYQGRDATLFFGFKDTDDVLIDAFTIFKGFMDSSSTTSGETSSISMRINNELSLWERRKIIRNNNEDHQKDNPGDNFFEFVEDLRFADYTWGRERS